MATLDQLLARPIQWAEVDSQTNAQAAAVRAAATGMQHYICSISISASAAPAAAVQAEVRQGSTVLDRFEIPAAAFSPFVHNYSRPLQGATGGTVSVVIPALGAGVRGTAVIKGFTARGG